MGNKSIKLIGIFLRRRKVRGGEVMYRKKALSNFRSEALLFRAKVQFQKTQYAIKLKHVQLTPIIKRTKNVYIYTHLKRMYIYTHLNVHITRSASMCELKLT